ncbi:hypothetical protein FACS1894170_06870 [Planctomycetales bacterium]|nr:hypothetical protein FACS1894170_06870 [Planctomycetales bacterium]
MLGVLQKYPFVKTSPVVKKKSATKTVAKKLAKEKFLSDLRQAFQDVKNHEAGKIQLKTLDEITRRTLISLVRQNLTKMSNDLQKNICHFQKIYAN